MALRNWDIVLKIGDCIILWIYQTHFLNISELSTAYFNLQSRSERQCKDLLHFLKVKLQAFKNPAPEV